MKNLTQVIEQSRGKIFSVTFTKKDGTLRRMTARMGVTSKLRGGHNSNNADKYITVYDMVGRSYKNVNRETIREVKFGGRVYGNCV
jgi:hypothetical protein